MLIFSPKCALSIASGVVVASIIGYCIYFDRKRRADPQYRRKLVDRRRDLREAQRKTSNFPDLRNHEAVQQFFLQEVQMGEELLAGGELDGGVDHLANAVAVCGEPNQLLQVLQQTLQPHVFHLLALRLPTVAPRVFRPGRQVLPEEDVQ